jgi:hypothetical protein
MTITITEENGTGVTGANSFTDLDTVKAAIPNNGLAVPADDEDTKLYMIRAYAHIGTYERQFSGYRSNRGQTGVYPRTTAYSGETPLDNDEIPVEIVQAQIQLVCDQIAGLTLGTFESDQTIVIEEQVGPIREKRTEKAGLTNDPKLTVFNSIIEPLLKGNGFIGGLTLSRA